MSHQSKARQEGYRERSLLLHGLLVVHAADVALAVALQVVKADAMRSRHNVTRVHSHASVQQAVAQVRILPAPHPQVLRHAIHALERGALQTKRAAQRNAPRAEVVSGERRAADAVNAANGRQS